MRAHRLEGTGRNDNARGLRSVPPEERDARARRVEYFRAKLDFEKCRADVLHAVTSGKPLDFVLIDVRRSADFAAGHIPGARSVPLRELARVMGSLPYDREIVTYCYGHD